MKTTPSKTACELYLGFLNPQTGEMPLCARCHRPIEDHLAAVEGVRFNASAPVDSSKLPILATLVMLILPLLAYGQQEPAQITTLSPNVKIVGVAAQGIQYPTKTLKSDDSPWNLNAKLSSVAFGAAFTFDCLSSNHHEINGLLRSSDGSINKGVCFGLNGGVLGLTIALQKKYPRGMSWLRWIGAGGHTAVGFHNEAIKR
jgi:hypothetical protein